MHCNQSKDHQQPLCLPGRMKRMALGSLSYSVQNAKKRYTSGTTKIKKVYKYKCTCQACKQTNTPLTTDTAKQANKTTDNRANVTGNIGVYRYVSRNKLGGTAVVVNKGRREGFQDCGDGHILPTFTTGLKHHALQILVRRSDFFSLNK